MIIINRKNKTTVSVNIIYRKGEKCVSFAGVTMKISGNTFKKHWAILEN
jgi:hypothetical protein